MVRIFYSMLAHLAEIEMLAIGKYFLKNTFILYYHYFYSILY